MAKKVSRTAKKVGDSIDGSGLYPHLKITRETFPRLLATRKVIDEEDEYFGAFLPVTNLRIWLYHLNRIFRLRSCDIEIDGSFPQPCALFFTKKCLGPCVAAPISSEDYLEHVEALRLFLKGDPRVYKDFIFERIDAFSEALEFEKAAHWRDIWEQSQLLATNRRLDVRLDSAVDTYSIVETRESFVVYLVTSRGRKLVGNREFIFEKHENTAEGVMEKILRGFYRFHAPREIRLPFPLENTSELRRGFYERFGKDVRISVHYDELNDAGEIRLKRTVIEFELEKIGGRMTPDEIGAELKTILGLKQIPKRIEAFDVAHISNLDFVSASCVWENGEIRPDQMRFRVVEAGGEPQAMALGVMERLIIPPAPDLILVDGGKGQLNAVKEALENAGVTEVSVISAAKPAGKHKEISYFLNSSGVKVEFKRADRAHELLRELRDEAHQNANSLHRQHRENKYIFEDVNLTLYLNETERKTLLKKFGSAKAIREAAVEELAAEVGAEKAGKILEAAENPSVLPLVVTRLNEIGGAAGDIRPINAKIDG